MVAAVSMLAVSACGGEGKGAEDLASPQREIRQTVDNFYRAQEGDFRLYKSAVCKEKLEERFKDVSDRQFAKGAREAVEQDGRFIVDWFDEVKVTGGTADVTFTGHALGGLSPDLGDQRKTTKVVQEDGAWKLCEFPEEDAATKRKFEQATDKAAVQHTLVDYFQAVGSGDRATALGLTSAAGNGMEVSNKFLEANAAHLAGSTVTSIQEITVNQDVAKSKFMVETPQFSVQPGAPLNREGGEWKVCNVSVLTPPIPKG